MKRIFLVLVAVIAAVATTTANAMPPTPKPVTTVTTSVAPDGSLITTTVTRSFSAPIGADVLPGGGGGGYGCADASRQATDWATATSVTAWMHVCFDGRGHIVQGWGDGYANVGCCEPLIHWAGWDGKYFYNDGYQARSFAQGAVEARAWAVFSFVTYYVGHPGTSITVNGWGTVS